MVVVGNHQEPRDYPAKPAFSSTCFVSLSVNICFGSWHHLPAVFHQKSPRITLSKHHDVTRVIGSIMFLVEKKIGKFAKPTLNLVKLKLFHSQVKTIPNRIWNTIKKKKEERKREETKWYFSSDSLADWLVTWQLLIHYCPKLVICCKCTFSGDATFTWIPFLGKVIYFLTWKNRETDVTFLMPIFHFG